MNNLKTPQTILVVDDEQKNLLIMESMLAPLRHRIVCASSGDEALTMVEEESPDLILLDVMMPDMDGFQVCRRIKNREGTRLIPIIMVTTLDGVSDRVRAFNSDADDFLTKPVDRHELTARVRSCLRIKSLNDQLERSESVLFALVETVEARDKYTVGHSKRVSELAVSLGLLADLSEQELSELKRGGLLHDIGKVGIPDAILQKPSRLTNEEFAVVKTHPAVGEKICRPLRSFESILPLIRSHHERLDGSGYPDGLRGDEVSTAVKILMIADTFDAVTSDRPYRSGMSMDQVTRIFDEESESGKLDAELVRLAKGSFSHWQEIIARSARNNAVLLATAQADA